MRHLEKCFDTSDVVVLAFDNYEHVPRAKCMTQSQRRRNIPAISFSERSELPCMVPDGEHWTHCIANRTFKTRVIELVLLRLPDMLLKDKPKKRLVVDYRQPVEYYFDPKSDKVQREMLEGLPVMGEADIKFTRFADRYGKLMVDSIDGDSIPIALLHHEMCLRKNTPPPLVSVYRLELKVAKKTDTEAAGKEEGGMKRSADGSSKKKERAPRTYEFVNIHALYEGLRQTIAQSLGRIQMPSHAVHEMGMLISLISLTGTDFSRNLPQMSGKTVYSFLPDVWPTLAMAYDPANCCLRIEQSLNYLVALLYRTKFPKHVSVGTHASLEAVLGDLHGSSGLSQRVKNALPSVQRIECTVRNTNWVLAYWTCGPAPDPVQAAYGFRLLPNGAVEYDDDGCH